MAWWVCKGEFKGYINITSTANATVTATTGTSSYSAVCDSSGVGQIKVKKKGAYTITSTGTYRTASATVTDKTPVTAVYTWQKWSASPLYSSVFVGSYSSSGTNTFWSGSGWTSVYGLATGYSFDARNRYVLTGGTTVGLASYGNMVGNRNYPYTGYPNQSNYSTELAMETNMATGGHGINATVNRVFCSPGLGGDHSNANVYSSTISSYEKGGTQYSDATGTTLDAHPSNGRDSTDGYWYIAA